jgi:hypothetical protein
MPSPVSSETEGIIACKICELPVGDARGAKVMSNEEDPAR